MGILEKLEMFWEITAQDTKSTGRKYFMPWRFSSLQYSHYTGKQASCDRFCQHLQRTERIRYRQNVLPDERGSDGQADSRNLSK